MEAYLNGETQSTGRQIGEDHHFQAGAEREVTKNHVDDIREEEGSKAGRQHLQQRTVEVHRSPPEKYRIARFQTREGGQHRTRAFQDLEAEALQ